MQGMPSSVDAILKETGIVNAKGNVMGMMPHPERACEAGLGSVDGRGVFESILKGCLGKQI